jgi:hypothetical protein
MRPNLLIVRAGDASLHPRWLGNAAPRSFDLLVSYYGATPGRFRDDGDIYHAMTGPRWPGHDAIFSENREFLARYRRIALACDDLDATVDTWNRLFHLSEWYGLDLAQPAVLGHASYEITRPHPGCLLRYTNYVESMCPTFSQRALGAVRHTFAESVSGWGLGSLWSSLLPWPEYRTAIIDQVCVTHTLPVRQGSLRPTLDALGIDPAAEMREIARRHALADFRQREYARLTLTSQMEEEGGPAQGAPPASR